MKLGMSTASLFPKVLTENAFDVFRKLQVDTAEVFLNTRSEYRKSFIKKLLQRKGDINIHSVHVLGVQFEPQLFNGNARVRADAEDIFKKVCEVSAMLGAKFYTFHGMIRFKVSDTGADYNRICDRLGKLCLLAKSFGINLSYENVQWTYADKPEFFANVFEQCPDLYTTLDVKQAALAKVDPLEFLNVMNKHISTFHFCDVTDDGKTALPGRGCVDFKNIAAEAAKLNITAPAFMEVYTRDYENFDELSNSYNFLKECVENQ